jgi:hypothetical protein
MKVKPGYTDVDTVYVRNMQEFAAVIRAHGHLLRVSLAWRLADVTKQYLYRLCDEGYFRKFQVFGELHISEAEFQTWFDCRKKPEAVNAQLEFA